MWLQAQVRLSKSTKDRRKENCLSWPFFQIVKGAIHDGYFVVLLNCVRTKTNRLPASPSARQRIGLVHLTLNLCRTVEEDPSADGTTRHTGTTVAWSSASIPRHRAAISMDSVGFFQHKWRTQKLQPVMLPGSQCRRTEAAWVRRGPAVKFKAMHFK